MATSRSGITALIALVVLSLPIGMLLGTSPIYIVGFAAVLWLFGLMLRGAISRPYKPFNDDADLDSSPVQKVPPRGQ